MDLKSTFVLITGGSEGIGLGLAKRFYNAGSTVMITGRNEARLKKAALEMPGIFYLINDIGSASERENLAQYIGQTMPQINMVINNAGIQRRVSLAEDNAPWGERQKEIDTLFSAPVHLNHLLMPLLLKDGRASAIVNITSGGAYIPQAFAPLYSACKAALHSYTTTLRHTLSQTNCRVVEIVPPAVKTSLAGPGLNHGAAVDDFCDAVYNKLVQSTATYIRFGPTETLDVKINDVSFDTLFAESASRFQIKKY